MKPMKFLVPMLFVFLTVAAKSQVRYPVGLPNPNAPNNYTKLGYIHADKGVLFTSKDTNWLPKYPTMVYWKHNGVDTAFWYYNMVKWQRLGVGLGSGVGGIVDWTLGYPTYDARYSPLAHSHAFSVITSKPNTLAGYGITDASPLGHSHTFAQITTKPNTLAGYGIIDAFTQAQADVLYSPIGHAHGFFSLTGRPNTLSGYGITDAVPSTRTITINGNAQALSSNVSFSVGTYTALPPLSINVSNQILADTTIHDKALITRWRMKQYLDSIVTSGGLSFYATEGLIGVGGHDVDVKDTLIIENLGVVTSKLADGAVTNPKLADGSVTTQKIQDNTIVTVDIADLQVTTPKLGNAAVTNSKLADLAVDDNKMATNQKIGSLPSLTTTDKTSVVAAINEVKAGLGGGGSGGIDDNTAIIEQQQLGSPVKGQAIGYRNPFEATTTTGLGDGQARFILVSLHKAATLTGVAYWLQTAGSFTADNTNGVALYSITGATYTKVAESANSDVIWKATSGTAVQVAFTTPYVATAGIYVVVLLYNSSAQTTAPVIAARAQPISNNLANFLYTNTKYISALTSPVAAFGANYTINTLSPSGTFPYVAVY